MIAMQIEATSTVRLFDERDLSWIDELLRLFAATVGQPWRVLLERIEHAPLRQGTRPVPQRARNMITNALRRVLGGRSERGRIARRLRAAVLGHPALDPAERTQRIAAAATSLGIEPADIESLLWADLARERPVVLPPRPPTAAVLAAYANVECIQREIRRARMIELRVWGPAHALVRTAARYGLITQLAREPDGALLMRITGPLALLHETTVYGRALGGLVPLLADHKSFELAIHCDFPSGPHTRGVTSPVLLPPHTSRLAASPADRLARDLVAREYTVESSPPPLAINGSVVFPDLAVHYGAVRWLVEIIGFSTADYLLDKLALYRAANERVILCVDAKRSPDVEEHPSLLPFVKRIDVDLLLECFADA